MLENVNQIKKELERLPTDAQYSICKDLSYASTHCLYCKSLQKRKFGHFKSGVEPWKMGVAGEVTDLVSELLSYPLPKDLREHIEAYRDGHINFSCDKAVSIITELYEELVNLRKIG